MIARTRQHVRPRGGILFEVLLSIAVFVGGASFVLAAASSTLDAQHRALRDQQAADLAASLMAELQTGALSITELREGLPRQVGSFEGFREQVEQRMASGAEGWSVEINTQRSEYPGLTLVELTVSGGMDGGAAGSNEQSTTRYTLRQLVRLRGADAEEFRTDELLEGLPTEAAP